MQITTLSCKITFFVTFLSEQPLSEAVAACKHDATKTSTRVFVQLVNHSPQN